MSNTDTLIELEPKRLESNASNICPDYDDDCDKVKNPVFCWMGTPNCDRAEGLCPLIHTTN